MTDENLIKLIGCFDYDRMKKQCQKYDLTKVTEIDNKSEEQLKTYEMTTEEEITKEDILNITGSMFDTMLNYVDNSNNELEQLQQENKKYKEVIDKLKDKTKENIENAKCEVTTLTIGDKAYYQYIEKILDNYVDILKEVE